MDAIQQAKYDNNGEKQASLPTIQQNYEQNVNSELNPCRVTIKTMKTQHSSVQNLNNGQDLDVEESRVEKKSRFQFLNCFCNIFSRFASKKQITQDPKKKNTEIQQNNQIDKKMYRDDQRIIRVAKEPTQSKISIQIKALRSLIKLGYQTLMPTLVSLKTSGGSRVGVDLICVIDTSSSMQGYKISLVKETLIYLLEVLKPQDRISIVRFSDNAQRLCKLMNVSHANKGQLKHIINSLQADGGTNIFSGLQTSMQVLANRIQQNEATSIFLLSDGQNNHGQVVNQFKQYQSLPEFSHIGVYSLHTFGFGADHNQDIMAGLCRIKDGSFYFIQKLNDLDLAFVNAVGGMLSISALKVRIQISEIAEGIVSGIRIKKTYGDMWKRTGQNKYEIEISQLSSDLTKDFVLELEVPYINSKVNDVQRNFKVLHANFSAHNINNEQITGSNSLVLTVLNQDETVLNPIQNRDVIQNFLRVRTAEAISIIRKKADQYKFQQAKKGIDEVLQEIKGNSKVRKQKVAYLVQDLERLKQKCSTNQWGSSGRKISMSSQLIFKTQTISFENLTQKQLSHKVMYMRSNK